MRPTPILLLALCLSGCTHYERHGFINGGYRDQQLGESTFLVYFDSGGFADNDKIQSFLLYRCAELTVERGYEYFVLGDLAMDPPRPFTKPTARATIQLFRGPKPADNPKAYDARETMKYLGPAVVKERKPVTRPPA